MATIPKSKAIPSALRGPKKDPDTNYDDTQGVIEELKELKKQGIDCIVDVTNRGMGRDARILSNVAKQTGLTIIAK
jgi:phosphotriesterase-related protein